MIAAQFPGQAYGFGGKPLTAEAPVLNETLIGSFRYLGAVMAEEPDPDEEINAALIWVLRDGAGFPDVPAAWVSRAVDLLGEGGAVLLIADDAATERNIRDGLLDRLHLQATPAAGMGRA